MTDATDPVQVAADMADDSVDALRALWSADAAARSEVEESCGPQKTCRNMKDVTFDGFAEPGSDLGSAWRERLKREGKWNEGAVTLHDLVFRDPTQTPGKASE